MTTLADLAEKIGGLTSEVRESRSDVRDLTAAQGDLTTRVAAVEEQLRARRLRERLIWSAVTAVGVATWGAIGLIPWRFWATLAKAITQP